MIRTFGITALLTLLASNALAALSALETRTIPSANGEYLLVLLIPQEERESRRQEYVAEQERLEAHYPQSGLYRNDGSIDVLWPIEYISIAKEIHVCNDGVHLVVTFLEWDGTTSDRGNAVDLYARGRLLAHYREDELIHAYLPRLALSHYCGFDRPIPLSSHVDELSRTLTMETNWGDAFVFDFTTGKIVDSRLPRSIIAVDILLAAFAGTIVWWLLWQSRHSRRVRSGQAL